MEDSRQSGVSIRLSIKLSIKLSTTETIGNSLNIPTLSTFISLICKQVMGAIRAGISTMLSLILMEINAIFFVASASIPLLFMLHNVPFCIVIFSRPEFIAIPISPPALPSIFLSCKSSRTLSTAIVIAVSVAKPTDSAKQ